MNISAIVSLNNAFVATRKYLQCLLLSKKCISSTISSTPDAFSAFPYLLRSCVGISLIDPAKSLHGYLIKCGCLSWVDINTSLIQMYLEFNEIFVARQLFDEMPVRSSQYFNSLIYRFRSCGLFKDVLNIFKEMVAFGCTPSYGSVCKAITACVELRSLESGRWVNDYVVQCGLASDTVICNMLMTMYIKMGRLDLAHCVFDGMEKKDVISWNSLITRYAQNGDWVVALNLFHRMKKECNVVHDNVTFLGVVVACSHGGNLELGQSIHGRCIRAGLFSDYRLGNSILDLYAKCGKIEYAELLFEDEVFEKSPFSWNSLILGYVQSCCYYKAVNCFKRLCAHSDWNPDAVTLANVIPAYSSLRCSDSIRSIHALITKKGIDMTTDVVLGTALIDAYGKCSDIVGAERLFNDIKVADTPIWNVMLTSYYLNNRADKGMLLFVQMMCSQIPVDSITAIALLQMSRKLGSLKIGKMVHAYCLVRDLFTHLKVENALLNMYMRCKAVENSEKLFQLMNVKNMVTWNIMFSGYVEIDSCSKVLTLFSQMLLDRVHRPDSVTFISLIHASAVVLAPHGADVAYAFVSKLGFDSDTAVMNSLMDAYAKNGFIHKARSIFVQMGETRDQWSWNVMIAGFATNGQEEKACELLCQMSQDGHEPDSITFKSLLFACAHSGMIEKGCYYFNLMVNKYKIHPDLEHWTCFINMFGRAGRLDEAYKLIDSILADHLSAVNPSDSHAIWGAFVDACRMYDNIELGEVAGRKLLELSPQNTGYQIMLSNLYASTMRWDDAMKARQVFNDGRLVKEAARSAVKM